MNWIETENETWIRYCSPESKRSEQGEPTQKKAERGVLIGKLIAIVFWNAQGVLLVRYVPKHTTINS